MKVPNFFGPRIQSETFFGFRVMFMVACRVSDRRPPMSDEPSLILPYASGDGNACAKLRSAGALCFGIWDLAVDLFHCYGPKP